MAAGFYWDSDGSFDWDFRPASDRVAARAAASAVAVAPRRGLVRVAAERPSARAPAPQASLPIRALVLAALTLGAAVAGLAIRTQLTPGAEPAVTVKPAARTAAKAPATTVPWLGEHSVATSAAPTVVRPRVVRTPAIAWHRSRSLGLPWSGHLVGGVRLPAEGRTFVSWDPILERSPSRAWRRYGSQPLVSMLLGVLAAYHRDHPDAPRVAVGDLSRPHGGSFGRRYGGLGHVSHQNGLDVDVYYPRLDRKEAGPSNPGQIDTRLAQDLVNRFVAAGAQFVFVGPNTRLHGPAGVVQRLAHHDDHMHVRIYPGRE